MIQCEFIKFSAPFNPDPLLCGAKADRFFILSGNIIKAYCYRCCQHVPGKIREIPEEQYLKYQILK